MSSLHSACQQSFAFSPVITTLRGSGQVISIWGEMSCGVPDAGGCRVEVFRIETEDEIYEITPME